MTADEPAVPPPPNGSLADLSVCLTCFSLRGDFAGREHRCPCQDRSDEWRATVWGRSDSPEAIALCDLCVRATKPSGSRWSWLACRTCLRVNHRLGQVMGGRRAGALPLGRHSLMNGVALSGSDLDDESVDDFATLVSDLAGVWTRLADWRREEGQRLAVSAGVPDAGTVALDEWLARFPTSVGSSVDAICRFIGSDLPDHPDLEDLHEERAAFLAVVSEGSAPLPKVSEGDVAIHTAAPDTDAEATIEDGFDLEDAVVRFYEELVDDDLATAWSVLAGPNGEDPPDEWVQELLEAVSMVDAEIFLYSSWRDPGNRPMDTAPSWWGVVEIGGQSWLGIAPNDDLHGRWWELLGTVDPADTDRLRKLVCDRVAAEFEWGIPEEMSVGPVVSVDDVSEAVRQGIERFSSWADVATALRGGWPHESPAERERLLDAWVAQVVKWA